METIDLRKKYKHLYKPGAKTPEIVEVPRLRFLMVHGEAYPGEPEYLARMQALFTIAYPLKFAAKKELGISYPVMPPEGLYWDPTGAPLTDESQDRTMHWTLMSLVPNEITPEFMSHVREEVRRKKGDDLPLIDEFIIEDFIEGTSVQGHAHRSIRRRDANDRADESVRRSAACELLSAVSSAETRYL